MYQSYRLERLNIEPETTSAISWKEAGGATIKGTEYSYFVKDTNFRSFNQWTFVVRVPDWVYGDVVVQPLKVPNKSAWAGLERRAALFVRATKNGYHSHVYCKLNLADPTQERNRVGTRWGERDSLPKWFRLLRCRMRLKRTVANTDGTDEWAQVILARRDDHPAMIRLYFAMRVWILEEGFVLN